MKYKCYLKDIKQILEKDFQIKCSKINEELSGHGSRVYLFTVSGIPNLKRVYNQIKLTHIKKRYNLIRRINEAKETYGLEAKKRVYSMLKEYGPKTSKELAFILNRDKRTIHQHLAGLKKWNKVF